MRSKDDVLKTHHSENQQNTVGGTCKTNLEKDTRALKPASAFLVCSQGHLRGTLRGLRAMSCCGDAEHLQCCLGSNFELFVAIACSSRYRSANKESYGKRRDGGGEKSGSYDLPPLD